MNRYNHLWLFCSRLGIGALCTMALLYTSCTGQPSHFVWPQGKQAAIVLTYDDALQSQLNEAIPQLDSLSLTATFFLDGRMTEEDRRRWKQAADNGHELANHSVFHPCSRRTLSETEHPTEDYTVVAMLAEIQAMNHQLQRMDQKTIHTYAYPCGETSVGDGDYKDTLQHSGLVTYARGVGGPQAIITNLHNIDFFEVPAYGVPQQENADALIDFAKRTLEKKGLGIYLFHGIGGDYLKVSAEDHQALVAFLAAHQHDIWIAPFDEVMAYVKRNTTE